VAPFFAAGTEPVPEAETTVLAGKEGGVCGRQWPAKPSSSPSEMTSNGDSAA